ncbi:MAG: glycine/D-amino acid oxidase-like deaminating enzyme [Parasphingorhabdus sp.]|jgi:glycine/D-amino acid oxidase-like deaminating enzyme
MKDFDLAIVGGGLLGAAFGWGLACLGLRTVIFDEGDNAIRTARGNFGLVWVQGKGSAMPEYAQWSLESSRLWTGFAEQLQKETGIDTHYHKPGGFVICLDETESEKNQTMLETMRADAGDKGYDYELLDYAALKSHIPQVGKVDGASYCAHDGHCDPLKLLRALQQGFQDKGGSYKPLTPISRVSNCDGGFEIQSTDGATVARSEKVIVAAGHGSKILGEQLGLDVPIFPDQGQILITEKVAPFLPYPTNVMRQTDEGNLMLGASSRDVGYDLKTDTKTLQEVAACSAQAFPLLNNLRIQRTWAALRIMTPDGFPVYQQSESHPGAFSFACHSGVTLAANHALIVSQWVKNGVIPEQFQVFHPDRFHV